MFLSICRGVIFLTSTADPLSIHFSRLLTAAWKVYNRTDTTTRTHEQAQHKLHSLARTDE